MGVKERRRRREGVKEIRRTRLHGAPCAWRRGAADVSLRLTHAPPAGCEAGEGGLSLSAAQRSVRPPRAPSASFASTSSPAPPPPLACSSPAPCSGSALHPPRLLLLTRPAHHGTRALRPRRRPRQRRRRLDGRPPHLLCPRPSPRRRPRRRRHGAAAPARRKEQGTAGARHRRRQHAREWRMPQGEAKRRIRERAQPSCSSRESLQHPSSLSLSHSTRLAQQREPGAPVSSLSPILPACLAVAVQASHLPSARSRPLAWRVSVPWISRQFPLTLSLLSLFLSRNNNNRHSRKSPAPSSTFKMPSRPHSCGTTGHGRPCGC